MTAEVRLSSVSPENRPTLENRGRALFSEHACATCHVASEALPGVTLKKLKRLATRYSIHDLEAFLLAPQPPMPIFDLPEADRHALAIYLLSTHGD